MGGQACQYPSALWHPKGDVEPVDLETWQIGEPAFDVALDVSPDALYLRSKSLDLSTTKNLQRLQPKSRLGSLLPALIPQLLEMQLAKVEAGAIAIDHHD